MERTENSLDSEIMAAWRQAGADLGIRVEIPFVLITEGHVDHFEVHVLDFGGPKGILTGKYDKRDQWKRAKDSGYFMSELWPSYRKYKRQLFIDTLDDWKWFGPVEVHPAWYTGKNWS